MKKFIMKLLRGVFLKQSGLERISPNDWVKIAQIQYDAGAKTLSITGLEPEVRVFGIADTGSMDGLMDYGHNVILTNNFDKDKLAVGDIVAFQVWAKLVLHRIVEMGEDDQGKWYHTRGDNCVTNDPYRLRNKDIKWLCKGIIY